MNPEILDNSIRERARARLRLSNPKKSLHSSSRKGESEGDGFPAASAIFRGVLSAARCNWSAIFEYPGGSR